MYWRQYTDWVQQQWWSLEGITRRSPYRQIVYPSEGYIMRCFHWTECICFSAHTCQDTFARQQQHHNYSVQCFQWLSVAFKMVIVSSICKWISHISLLSILLNDLLMVFCRLSRSFEHGNNVHTIEEYAFDGIPVNDLRLRGQPQLKVNDKAFASIEGQTFNIIDLRCNRIRSMGQNVFNNIDISKLTLRFNELSTLPANTFDGLHFTANGDKKLILVCILNASWRNIIDVDHNDDLLLSCYCRDSYTVLQSLS